MFMDKYNLYEYLRILMDEYNLKVMSTDDYSLYGPFLNV